MVLKKALSVEAVRANMLAMKLLMAPSEHLPASLLADKHIRSMIQFVQEAVSPGCNAPEDNQHISQTGVPDDSHVNTICDTQARCTSDTSSITRFGRDLNPFQGPIEEIDALCTFIAGMKASIHDDDLIDNTGVHRVTGKSATSCAPSYTHNPHTPLDMTRILHTSAEHDHIWLEGAHLTTAPAAEIYGWNDTRGMTDLTSPPTMMREAPRARAMNRSKVRIGIRSATDLVPAEGHPTMTQCSHPTTYHTLDANRPLESVSSVSSALLEPVVSGALDSHDRQVTNRHENSYIAQTVSIRKDNAAIWKPSDVDCVAFSCTSRGDSSGLLYDQLLDRGGQSGEWSPSHAMPASHSGPHSVYQPPRPPPHQSRRSLNAARAFSGATHKASSADVKDTSQAHARCWHALTQANIDLNQVPSQDNKATPHATPDSSQSSSGDSHPSMVLNAAVHAFCETQGRFSAQTHDANPEAVRVLALLSAANLEGQTQASTPRSSDTAAVDWSDDTAPTTPPQYCVVLPPSNTIPGCKSAEPDQLAAPSEASKKLPIMHTKLDTNRAVKTPHDDGDAPGAYECALPSAMTCVCPA